MSEISGHESTYDRFAASFWRDLALSNSQGVPCEQSDMFFPAFSTQHFPAPSVVLLKDIFLKRFFQNEELYVNAMKSLKANWITCNHTFKSVCNIGYERSEDGKWMINHYNSAKRRGYPLAIHSLRRIRRSERVICGTQKRITT